MTDRTPPTEGSELARIYGFADLTIAATVVLWVYIAPFDSPSVNLLRAFPGLVGLLFVPGYLTILSILSVTSSENKLGGLEVLLLSFVISVTIIPVIGLGLNFMTSSADPETIVNFISAYSLISVFGHFVYRYTSDSTHNHVKLLDVRGYLQYIFQRETRTDTVLNITILFLLLLGLAAVVVPVPGQSNPQFTEFGLLTQNESGDLAMDGYLSDLDSTESRTVYADITNKEGRAVDYTLVIQIQRTELREQSVAVLERRQVVQNRFQLHHNESTQIPYRFTLEEGQTGCRVAFLLYAGELPESPTIDNAYRELHLWHTDDPPPRENSCSDLSDISVQSMSSESA